MSMVKGFIKHFFNADVLHECRRCGEKTWHSHIEYKKAIQVIDRSGRGRYGRHKYCCILRAPEYYMNQYSVCRCQNCGKRVNIPGWPKKISAKKAKESGIEMVPNLAFWMSMYR